MDSTRVRLIVGLAALGGLFVACSSAEGNVQREWNHTLREMGINPVFPPREDVQVGDMYLRRGDPDATAAAGGKGFVPIDLWVASIETATIVQAAYGARPSFADTTTTAGTAAGGGSGGSGGEPTAGNVIRVPAHSGASSTWEHRDHLRLRQVAFPDFASMSVREGNLKALVPVEALSVAFGASWAKAEQVDVKIPAAESYGVPFGKIADKVLEKHRNGAWVVQDAVLPAAARLALHSGLEGTGAATVEERGARKIRAIYVDLLTEVFYARTIDISISTQSSFGARARVRPLVDPGAATSQPQQPAESTPVADPGGNTTMAKNALVRAQELNDELAKVDDLDQIGGSVQFVSASDFSVAMRRTYQRPIAVGWRGVTLKIDVDSGELLSAVATTSGQAFTTSGGVQAFRAAFAGEIKQRTPFAANREVAVKVRLPSNGEPLAVVLEKNGEQVDEAAVRTLLADAAQRREIAAAMRAWIVEDRPTAANDATWRQIVAGFEATAPALVVRP